MSLDLPTFYRIEHRLIALSMVALLLASCEVGYRLGSARKGADDSLRALMSGTGAAMFGLLGLLLGFALSMALGRWDARRDVIIRESNAIETLWLHSGLLEDPFRGELQEALRTYSSARIALGGSRSAPVLLLALLISAILLFIMDANRPQRGTMAVGVAPLERVAVNVSAPTS